MVQNLFVLNTEKIEGQEMERDHTLEAVAPLTIPGVASLVTLGVAPTLWLRHW